jgi:hypothetical protein
VEPCGLGWYAGREKENRLGERVLQNCRRRRMRPVGLASRCVGCNTQILSVLLVLYTFSAPCHPSTSNCSAWADVSRTIRKCSRLAWRADETSGESADRSGYSHNCAVVFIVVLPLEKKISAMVSSLLLAEPQSFSGNGLAAWIEFCRGGWDCDQGRESSLETAAAYVRLDDNPC